MSTTCNCQKLNSHDRSKKKKTTTKSRQRRGERSFVSTTHPRTVDPAVWSAFQCIQDAVQPRSVCEGVLGCTSGLVLGNGDIFSLSPHRSGMMLERYGLRGDLENSRSKIVACSAAWPFLLHAVRIVLIISHADTHACTPYTHTIHTHTHIHTRTRAWRIFCPARAGFCFAAISVLMKHARHPERRWWRQETGGS